MKNKKRLNKRIKKIARNVGYDLESYTWSNFPEQLEDACPGLPWLLNRLFQEGRTLTEAEIAPQFDLSRDGLTKVMEGVGLLYRRAGEDGTGYIGPTLLGSKHLSRASGGRLWNTSVLPLISQYVLDMEGEADTASAGHAVSAARRRKSSR